MLTGAQFNILLGTYLFTEVPLYANKHYQGTIWRIVQGLGSSPPQSKKTEDVENTATALEERYRKGVNQSWLYFYLI